MFSRSQALAGNATLASINSTLYSPTSPSKSQLWSLDTASPGPKIDLGDDFQSNMTFQVSPSGLSNTASTGLGIFYPPIGKTGTEEGNGGSRIGLNYDFVPRQRTALRTESTYEADISTGILEEPSPDPFSLSSLLVTGEFLRHSLDFMSDEPVIETRQLSTPSHVVQDPPALPSVPVDDQGRWVLQRILEASGHTIESLSAELRIRFGGASFSSAVSYEEEPDLQSNAAYSLDGFLRHPRDSPVLGINPAAIMPQQTQSGPFCPEPPSETPDLGLADAEDSEVEQTPLFLAPAPPVELERLTSPVSLTARVLEEHETILPYKKESDYEPSFSPSGESSNASAFMPIFSRYKVRTRSTKVSRRQSIKRVLASPYTVPSDFIIGAPLTADFPIDYGTPVLDAHRGIELSELKAKAERYRNRNQGVEYDKKWLLSFAGKLTPEGLMTEEYRCYIVGCNQLNRRRDHILIHVGGHLDQRPFACTHCSARFLRKNECKRHELSHTGARPFTCDICPLGVTAFVRQDLLKRHQKRTHNMDNTRDRTTKRHRQIK